MSCCGQRRRQAAQEQAAPSGPTPRFAAPAASAVVFEYVGATGLTAHGPITGIRYRFNRTGAVLAVDPRDAAALLAVPALRRVAAASPAP